MPPNQQKTETKSRESEVEDAQTGVMIIMHTITPSKDDVCLGTTVVEFRAPLLRSW